MKVQKPKRLTLANNSINKITLQRPCIFPSLYMCVCVCVCVCVCARAIFIFYIKLSVNFNHFLHFMI